MKKPTAYQAYNALAEWINGRIGETSAKADRYRTNGEWEPYLACLGRIEGLIQARDECRDRARELEQWLSR